MNNDNENSKLDDYYSTSDLALAATISLQFPILTIDRTNSPRVLFVFSRTPELDKLVARFWRNEITVNPQEFANQTKNLKTRIYSNE